MHEVKGTCTCSDCGYIFKWKLILRERSDSGIYPVTTVSDDEVPLNERPQDINGVDCYDCYCPNCGMPIYIPCNVCNTES